MEAWSAGRLRRGRVGATGAVYEGPDHGLRARPAEGNDVASRIVTGVRSIVLPPLSHRARELRRIIDAYAADAITAFGGGWLAPADWDWIERNASGSLPLIGMATRRIIALHVCEESVTRAAKLLSMSHGSLSDWLARRSLPGKVNMSDEDDVAET